MRLGFGLGVTALLSLRPPIAPPVPNAPVALGLEQSESKILSDYGTPYAGYTGQAFDTVLTATTPAQLEAHLATAKGDFTKKWQIRCAWDGVLDATGVTLSTNTATSQWFDQGGLVHVVNETGRAPAVGGAVVFNGVRGLHWQGVGFARKWSGSGSAGTQYQVAITRNTTHLGNPVIKITDVFGGANPHYSDATQADYVTFMSCSPATQEIVLERVTVNGCVSGLKTPCQKLRLVDVDVQQDIGDAISLVGHTNSSYGAYYMIVVMDRVTMRNLADALSNAANHMDFVQTGTAADVHAGYRLLLKNFATSENHSYAGGAQGGGTQGSYNDDHTTADNLFVIRNGTLLVCSPAGFAVYSPKASYVSYMDRVTITRSGRVPSARDGDVYAAQDFQVGVTAGSLGAVQDDVLQCLITNCIIGTQTLNGANRVQYVDCVQVDPRASQIGTAKAPENIFVGRDFSRGGAPANGIANKFGYDLPNELGTQAQFIADIWANFAPQAVYANKGAPDLRGLTWAAPFKSATPAPTVAINSVDANGWQADYKTPADLPSMTTDGTSEMAPNTAPQTVAVTRAGFNGAGDATSYAEQRVLTKRVRQAFPNQTSPTPSAVALDDYVYSSDAIAGATNNSAVVSPKPLARWAMPHRMLVADVIRWELVAFHRDFRGNRQVASVRVRANDGTTQTPWQTVSETTLSTLCEDPNPLEVFGGNLDISGLANGAVWLEAEIRPWIGLAASVLRSEDNYATSGTGEREFTRRWFLKNPARFNTPPLAYVSSTGSDSTGVWSTTAATAAATPFLTVAGALAAVNDASRGTPATGGVVDGGRIRIVNTVSLGTSSTSRPQNLAAVIVERAPGTTRANAIVTLAGSSFRARLGAGGTLLSGITEGAICFYDVTFNRTANFALGGESTVPLMVQFWNVAYSNNGTTGAHLSNAHDYMFGVLITGYAGQLNAVANQHRLIRGVAVDLQVAAVEGWAIIGCTLTGLSGLAFFTELPKGAVVYNNRLLKPSSAVAAVGFGSLASGETMVESAVVQNLFEVTHTTSSTAGLRIASDNAIGNSRHSVVYANTITGYSAVGRRNMYYDENNTDSERRTHYLMCDIGNVTPQDNNKGDVFVGAVQGRTTEAPFRLGHFVFHHGVGCHANIALCRTNSGTVLSEYQAFPGVASEVGTSATVPLYTPASLFTNYQGTPVGAGTAGAGGGNYKPAAGSALIGKVKRPGLKYDLAGAARPATNDAIGAYAA